MENWCGAFPYSSLLMESSSAEGEGLRDDVILEQGVSPDFVVCAGSPDIPNSCQEQMEELNAGEDCLDVSSSPRLFASDAVAVQSLNGLTQAMFPEVNRIDGADRWSEILLNTPIKAITQLHHTPPAVPSKGYPSSPSLSLSLFPGEERHGNATVETAPDSDSFTPDDEEGAYQSDIDMDPALCHPRLKLVTTGQDIQLPKEDAVMCIDAGGEGDSFFVGGDVLRTEENIFIQNEGPCVYQTARFGNFSYIIAGLPAGDYLLDLHFAEIVFTNGPPGMRVFNVFIQDGKILSELDIYARVGCNTPLVLMDAPANVIDGKPLTIRFEAVIGSPCVCAIWVRKSPSLGPNHNAVGKGDFKKADCNLKSRKCVVEYQRKLEEVSREYELKKKECHEAWMSLEDSNRQLEKLRGELMRKSLHVGSLAHAVEGQVNELRELQDKHEMEKKLWSSRVHQLNAKIKALKSEYIGLSEEANECASSLPDISGMTCAVQALVDENVRLNSTYTELKTKFVEESKQRKQLYNKVLELKGNIRVFCRCRPLSAEEVAAGASAVTEFDGVKDSELGIRVSGGAPKKVFKFDSVFTPEDDQVDVFADTAPVVVSVLDGYNVCIFAYGQTGTGKTFTMEGTKENRGVNYRTLEELFRVANERRGEFTYEISVSVLEVYNEQIRDLLASSSQPGHTVKKLEIKQVAEGVHHVPGLVEAQVHSMNEVWEVLQTGSSARAVGSTNANEHSSRSHCILCVMVRGENLINGECTRSKLWLVDLAGSERVAKTDVQGERLKEAQNINKSLSALGDVISALATKSSHIPFRNSKLTHLLQDSLGGDSKTLMFVQISPNENDISETLCSLNFASRVRGIELGPARKQLDSSELFKYKQMVEKAKQDGRSKDGLMKKMEETIQNLDTKLKGREQANKSLQDKIKELEGQLANERKCRLQLETKLKEQGDRLSEKPLVAMRHFGGTRSLNETGGALTKDLVNIIDPPPPPPQCNGKPSEGPTQKENKAELGDQTVANKSMPIPKSTGRASMSAPGARRTSMLPPATSRRISMVPLPCHETAQEREEEEEEGKETAEEINQPQPQPESQSQSLPLPLPLPLPQAPSSTSTPVSLRGLRTSNTLNRLRRSIHKKVHFNNSPTVRATEETNNTAPHSVAQKLPPLDTTRFRRLSSARGGGGGWGRISGAGAGTGSGVGAQRVLCANSNKPPALSVAQQREKERGWNR